MNEFIATDIQVKNEDATVVIQWMDGHKSEIPINRLRGFCPCAVCQGHAGSIKFNPNNVKQIRFAKAVGRYAVSLGFGDRHETGIFRYEYLRRLDPAEESRWGAPDA